MKSLAFPSVVTDSLAKQIAERIKEAIMDGRLKIDERLPTEEELARQFGVSRPTLREALKRLAAQKLIHSRRGPTGGTFVLRPNIEELTSNLASYATLLGSLGEFSLTEIAEARLELETVCCRLAAANRTDAALESLEAELVVQANKAISDEEFCASDIRFHRALVNATGNKLLQFVMYAVIEALQPASNLITYRFRERKTVLELHRKIVASLRNRNVEAASEAVAKLVSYVTDKYEDALAWRERRNGASRGTATR